MLGHNVRGQWWWYSSWGWTFQLIFHDILLLCDRWLQRGCLIKWCLTQKCIWSKGMELNSSMWKKNGTHWYTTLAERSWRSNSGCEHSEVVGGAFQQWWQWHGRQATFQMATHRCHTTKFIHVNQQIIIRKLYRINICFNMLEITLKYHKVCNRWVPPMLTQEQKEHVMKVCQDLLNKYDPEGDSFLDCTITSDEMWCQH